MNEAFETDCQAIAADRARLAGQAHLPLLVRDIAAEFGTTPLKICDALRAMGAGEYSVNMAVTKELYCELRGSIAAPVPAQAEKVGQDPVGYLPAYERDRLRSGHDARLRTPNFGPSELDGDIPVYAHPPTDTGREQLARWMIANTFSTGHGDTVDDLLIELAWQVREIRKKSTAPQSLLDAAEKALVSMVDVLAWRQTGLGRPPEQLMLDEVVALRAALQEHGRTK